MSLRRAYVLVILTVGAFFLLYILQATGLYNRSLKSQRMMEHTNAVMAAIEQVHVQLWKMQYEQLASQPQNGVATEQSDSVELEMRRNLDTLISLTRDNPLQQERLRVFTRLAMDKMATATPRTGIEREAIAALDDSISHYIRLMEYTEKSLLDQRTKDFNEYSNRRFLFSLTGYIVIFVFLVISLHVLYKDMRRRSRTEQEARLIERKYQVLVEASGFTTVVIDAEGQVRFASNNVYQLTGYSQAELMGVSVQQILPEPIVDDSYAITSGETVPTHERSITTKAGQQKWISFRMFPLPHTDGKAAEWQLVVWDIDAEKRLELELQRQQQMLQSIIDNIPSAISIKDLDGRYVMVNHRMEEDVARPASSILGRTDEDLVDDVVSLKRMQDADGRVISQKRMLTSEEMTERSGKKEYYWVIRFPLLNAEGHVTNVCVVSTNISDRKEGELKLLQATRAAERARAAQEAFLANMSHEIRTPMNGIIGMTNLLLGTSLEKDQQEYADNILESARHLLGIINDILDFTKIRSGKFHFDHIPFRLRHVLRKALFPLQLKSEEKKISLQVDIENDVPPVLIGDPLRLQQIIINLAGNAIKFTSEGGVKVHVRCATAEGQTGRVQLHIAISDTGIGIPHDKQQYIFESFTQNNANTSRKYGGTGLGLAIVKQLVELQGGRIKVESELEKGSTFTITMPLGVGQETSLAAAPAGGAPASQENMLKGLRVLVAEDNLINQKVVGTTLKRQGALVTIVGNGQLAVDELKGAAYDVVLMDLQMPGMDGYTATRHIRGVMRNATPIIAMTADALKGEAEKCFEAGMNGYISKPFEPKDLFAEILKWTTHITENEEETTEHMSEAQGLIDFSYLHEISGNDPDYIREVIGIYLGTMPEGLEQLEYQIRNTSDWKAIYQQAHFLKSSASVIRVGNMYEQLSRIEALAKESTGKEEITSLLEQILETFGIAEPLLQQEKSKMR